MSNVAIAPDDKPKELVKDKRVKSLNLNQQAFIQFYTDINSPTFGNKRGSYIQAYPGTTKESADPSVQTLLRKPMVIKSIEEALKDINYSDYIRINEIKSLAQGIPKKGMVIQRNADGDVISTTETVSSPSPTEMIKAHKLINEMTGLRENNKAIATTKSKVIASVVKQMLKDRDRGTG